MNDSSEQTTWVKFACAVTVLFFISMVVSCEELRYRTQAVRTTARVTNVVNNTGRYGRNGYKVLYEFIHVTLRNLATGAAVVSDDEVDSYHPGDTIAIEYFGDELPASRIVGKNNNVMVAIFVGTCLACLGVYGVLTVRYFREESRDNKRRASRQR